MINDFSAKPYFDDFTEQKGFHKILFKPGYSVQARELNQIQSIIQEQIHKFGNHIFKNGSMVIPGETKLNNTTARYVCLVDNNTDPLITSKLEGKTLYQDFGANRLEATVFIAEYVDGVLVAGVTYTNSASIDVGGQVENQTSFSTAAPILVLDEEANFNLSIPLSGPNAVNPVGKSVFASIKTGVFYVDGYFVHTDSQKTVVDWFSNAPSAKVGFNIVKSIVTAYDDVSLFDNALGSPNEGAPGADRLAIDLQWTSKPLADENDDFIELIRFVDGNLRVNKQYTQYNVIEETLARRTYDESGDYAVQGLGVSVIDHLKSDLTPRGLKTAADGGNDNLFAVEITPGKAYIKGYEVENLSNLYIEANKARTEDCVKFSNDVLQVNENGQYIYLAPGNEFFDLSRHPIIWLTNGVESTSTIIGYCIPKHVQSVSISGNVIFKLFGSFFLTQPLTFNWHHIGGWKINSIKNGGVLQVATLFNVTGEYNVSDGLQMTSHPGYTPYAWDSANKKLYLKKTQAAPKFNTLSPVTKGSTSGTVQTMTFTEIYGNGSGDLIPMGIKNIKSTKDANGNTELQADVGFTCVITTNASGYGEFLYTGAGVFTGQPVAAHTQIDNAYFNNIVNIIDGGTKLIINNSSYPNAVFSVSAVLRKNLAVRTKTLTEGQTSIAAPSTRLTALAHGDVYKIKAVHMSASLGTPATISDQNVTDSFTLESGDTLDFYSNTFIKLKNGLVAPSGQLLVVYDYFLHGAGEVFTVDSYVALRDNIADETDFTHIGRIPKFKFADTSYNLYDYLDFRKSVRSGFFVVRATVVSGSPNITLDRDYSNVVTAGSLIRSNGFTDSATVVSVNSTRIVANQNSTFTGTVYVVVNTPTASSAIEPFNETDVKIWAVISGSAMQYDALYFSERRDRVVMTKNGEFRYIYGLPGIKRFPDAPLDSMSIATLIVPPYTHSAAQINTKRDDNRRYTMRDIGKLERRIESLEYYSTLSLKEINTSNTKVVDAETGLDRFKSGFFVDDFRDFGTMQVYGEGFLATINTDEGKLIPLSYSTSMQMAVNTSTSVNFTVKKNKLMLPYIEQVEFEQPFATKMESVNPYLIVSWTTRMELIPAVDNWIETEWAPSVTNITELFRTVENNSTVVVGNITNVATTTTTNNWNFGWGVTTTSSTTTQNAVGVTTTSSTNTTESRNDSTRLLGTSIIPLMRSKLIKFEVSGAKPSTRYWVSFDGVGVSHLCRPINPTTQVAGTFGSPIMSDPMGTIHGQFELPHNTFSTGTKTLTLADFDIITFPEAGTECTASSNYTANGEIHTFQEVIDITRTTVNTINRVTAVNNVTTIQQVNNINEWVWDGGGGDGGGGDPLAQSFDTFKIPAGGMFITKIDLYFGKKDPTQPVFLELREMYNGYPVTDIIPGSVVVVNPAQINVSADSTAATPFVFDAPIYLHGNKEYCFIVKANTSRHWLWISRMGEKVVNMDRVVGEQPHLGSLFKSQNASTWTPEQLEDIKFKIYRAKFNVDTVANVMFENSGAVCKKRITVSAFRSTNGSKVVRVTHPNHGTLVNEYVTISAESTVGQTSASPAGTVIFNGIPMSELYGDKVVKNVIDINTYEIEVVTSATATGGFGDIRRYVWIDSNVNYNAFKFIDTPMVPEECQVKYYASLITGKDYDGGQSSKTPIDEFEVKIGDANAMQEVGLLMTDANETTTKSAVIRYNLRTFNEYVTPVIDLNGSSIIVNSMALNMPLNDVETQAAGGIAASKAISQVIRLKTPATSLRIYTTESKQENSGIEVFYRTTSDLDIQLENWILIEPVATATVTNADTYIEHERKFDGVPEFYQFQLKIVFKGTNSVKYPSLKDIRAIAVAT